MTQKISFLNVIKFFFFLILIYAMWFQYAFFMVPNILLTLGLCMLGFLITYFYKKDSRIVLPVTVEYAWWLMFFIFSFISGMFIAASKTLFFSAIITGVNYLMTSYILFLIVSQEKKIDFFMKVIIVCAVLAAVTTILFPVELIKDPGRYTINLKENANALAFDMLFGIFCSIYLMNFRNMIKAVFLFVSIGLMFYTIILTGSRKTLISAVLLLVIWMILLVKKSFNFLQAREKRISIIVFVSLLLIVICVLVLFLENSVIIARMQMLFENGVPEDRAGMYQSAFDLFLKNPFIGIGYEQFQVVTGLNLYSHSTYAEALSCTGIIGFSLYFIPYGYIILKLIKKAKLLYKTQEEQYAYIWIVMFVILLFLGTGMIHYYEFSTNILFGMMISFANLNIQNPIRTDSKLKGGGDYAKILHEGA